ncbi:MAG: histidine phosphatase family protein, partial [Thiohalophilus sp.]
RPLGFDMNNVYFDPGLYLASRKNLVEIIAAQSLSEGSIMLVGHNPGLEELLTWLCHEPLPRTEDGKLLTTANLARIQLDKTGKLAEGNGKLVELTRANELA